MPDPSPSPQPVSTVNNDPTWDIVVFQVEDRIFHAFRHTFTAASEVFQGLFLLPQDDSGEGLSRDRPIVLHGCRANDFAALMKVLHPTMDNMVTGSYDLSREEWIGVLRLATMWEMGHVRELAVESLFDEDPGISALEKVVLAQEFRVRSWFLSGVGELLSSDDDAPLATLLDRLGTSTTCKIKDLQHRCNLTGLAFREDILHIPLELLNCDHCMQPFFKADVVCGNTDCAKVHSLKYNLETSYVFIYSSQHIIRASTRQTTGLGFSFAVSAVNCTWCVKPLFSEGIVTCETCVAPKGVFVLEYTDSYIQNVVADAFEDELKSYDM